MVIAFGSITSYVVGWFFPGFYATQALVSPARVRTLSFSFGSLFLVAGVWLLYFIPGFAALADSKGNRWGLAVTAPYWIITGLILRSGHKHVADDTTRAMSLLSMTAELRHERLDAAAGTGSLLMCRGVEVAYDQVQVLFGVDLEVTRGRDRRAARHQRRRQVDAAQGDQRPRRPDRRRASSSTAATSPTPTRVADREAGHRPGARRQGRVPDAHRRRALQAGGWLYRDDPDVPRRRRSRRCSSTFPRLRERWDQMAGNLSGGEQQQLALGMAFVAKPKLLIIDELSLGLAPTIVEQLLDIVRRIHAQGTAIILVEQSINVALTIAERAYFMEKGEVRFAGPTAELLERGDILRSVFLEGAATTNGRARRPSAARARTASGRRRPGRDGPSCSTCGRPHEALRRHHAPSTT